MQNSYATQSVFSQQKIQVLQLRLSCSRGHCGGATPAKEQPQLLLRKRRGCILHSALPRGPGQEARDIGGRTVWGTWGCWWVRLGFKRAWWGGGQTEAEDEWEEECSDTWRRGAGAGTGRGDGGTGTHGGEEVAEWGCRDIWGQGQMCLPE